MSSEATSKRGPAVLLATLVLALIAAGCGSDGRVRAREAWEVALGFDPDASYVYPFERRQSTAVAVELGAEGFSWPALPAAADTLLLELEVEAGGSRQPSLVATAGGRQSVQYFAPRSEGRRFLDLTLLQPVLEAGELVSLEGRGLRWRPGEATLWTFGNPPLEDRRVLVLAPHPDDAEIAAFGVYVAADSDVVTVTAGDAGGWNYRALWPQDAGHHYRVKGEVRTWDSITIPGLGGVPLSRARNLGYYDATLRELWRRRPEAVGPPLAELPTPDHFRRLNPDPALSGSAFESSWPALVADLRRQLEQVEPEVVVAPHPFLDAHADHQFTTIALIEALEAGAVSGDLGPGIELYLYTNHAVGAELWPFGPADGTMGLPPSFDSRLEFDRLHSWPLDEETRRRKLLALEAMHDLRPFELGEPVPARRHLGRFFDEIGDPELPDFRYFRRAARPNELFFVLSLESAGALRERFLHQAEEEARAAEKEDADVYP